MLSKHLYNYKLFYHDYCKTTNSRKSNQVLQVDEFDNSCDENEDITARSVIQATLKNSDLSDCDSDEPSNQPISENFNETQSSINRWETLSSRAGVSCKRISDTVNRGRAAAENIFLKDHILKEVSYQKVHSAHFVCLLMSPCFVKFKNILSSMDKLMQKFFCENLQIGKIYWSPNSTWCFDGKKHSNSSTVE